jgi:5-formyltetrahydrofolate cyclo-ligase
MTFRFSSADVLEERGLGFCEPDPTAQEASRGDLDVLIVPAIAIDPTGHRIGYGAGFYDRTIVRFAPPAVTIGVAFDFQLVAEVPFTEHDVPLSHVVTDEREIVAAALGADVA